MRVGSRAVSASRGSATRVQRKTLTTKRSPRPTPPHPRTPGKTLCLVRSEEAKSRWGTRRCGSCSRGARTAEVQKPSAKLRSLTGCAPGLIACLFSSNTHD